MDHHAMRHSIMSFTAIFQEVINEAIELVNLSMIQDQWWFCSSKYVQWLWEIKACIWCLKWLKFCSWAFIHLSRNGAQKLLVKKVICSLFQNSGKLLNFMTRLVLVNKERKYVPKYSNDLYSKKTTGVEVRTRWKYLHRALKINQL